MHENDKHMKHHKKESPETKTVEIPVTPDIKIVEDSVAPQGELIADKDAAPCSQQVADLEIKLADAEKKCAELEDKMLRILADYDNFRKRTIKEKAEWNDLSQNQILESILPVLDNFDLALKSIPEDLANHQFIQGIMLVDKQLHDILAKNGLTEIDSVNQPFDPNLHEAMMVVETIDVPDNTVVDEIRKGYLRKDKVIRHAMVRVAQNITLKPTSES